MRERSGIVGRMHAAFGVAALTVLAGCAVAPAPAPEKRPPQPAPQTQVAPQVQSPPPEWQDLPITPGNWSYRESAQNVEALFTPASGDGAFSIRCNRQTQLVGLSRAGVATGTSMKVRTSTDVRALTVVAEPGPPALASATLPATDPFLDSIAFSRGRFSVELAGTSMLVIPSWSEPSRVIEDCRG